MDRLEAVEKSFCSLKIDNPTLRLDSEYLKKEYIKILKGFEMFKTEKLAEIAKWITQGPNPTFKEGGLVPCLTGRNICKGRIEYEAADYVDELEYQRLQRFQILTDDTLITLKGKGSIGKIGFVFSNKKAIFSRDIGIIRPKNINPAYLNAFVLSKYGQLLVLRGETGGTGQSTLTTSYLKHIPVPIFKTIESPVGGMVKKSEKTLKESNISYDDAQNLLLSELGLSDYTPTQEKVSVRSFASSFGASGRLDAEYYQPKYEEIEDRIKNYKNGYKILNDFIDDYSTGFPYKSEDYIDNGDYYLIRINNIVNGSLDVSSCATLSAKTAMQSPKDYVKIGDIIISMSGTIGSACCIRENVMAVINQRILRITPKNIDNSVLALYVNSLAGYSQFERIGTGGVQTNISSVDMKNILIPNFSEEMQKQIADKIQQSFTLRKKSTALLEYAKQAVEMAIEQGEDVAMKWLEGVQ